MNLRIEIESKVGVHINPQSPAFKGAVDRLEETINNTADEIRVAEVERLVAKLDLTRIVAAIATSKPARKRRIKANDDGKPSLPVPPPLPMSNGELQ